MICASLSASQVSMHVWLSGAAPNACVATGGTYAFDICTDKQHVQKWPLLVQCNILQKQSCTALVTFQACRMYSG